MPRTSTSRRASRGYRRNRTLSKRYSTSVRRLSRKARRNTRTSRRNLSQRRGGMQQLAQESATDQTDQTDQAETYQAQAVSATEQAAQALGRAHDPNILSQALKIAQDRAGAGDARAEVQQPPSQQQPPQQQINVEPASGAVKKSFTLNLLTTENTDNLEKPIKNNVETIDGVEKVLSVKPNIGFTDRARSTLSNIAKSATKGKANVKSKSLFGSMFPPK